MPLFPDWNSVIFLAWALQASAISQACDEGVLVGLVLGPHRFMEASIQRYLVEASPGMVWQLENVPTMHFLQTYRALFSVLMHCGCSLLKMWGFYVSNSYGWSVAEGSCDRALQSNHP